MAEPVQPSADETNYLLATMIQDTLGLIAEQMRRPEPSEEDYAHYATVAKAMGVAGTMCAWRVAAGLAAIAGMKPDQVAELGQYIGARPDPDST
jgi:hypothetical protein